MIFQLKLKVNFEFARRNKKKYHNKTSKRKTQK